MSQSPSAPRGSVLVVGVGSPQGLGAAIARRFAAGGFPVLIAGRSKDKLEATLAELKASGGVAALAVGDATAAADVAGFVAAAQALAPLAVAVHNAGGNRPAPFLKITQEQFETHLARARPGRLPPGPGRPAGVPGPR